MPLPNLNLPPDQANYQATWGQDSVAVQLEGGASRFRRDYLGAAFVVQVQWTLNAFNFAFLTAFYRTAINFGADPFTIDLMLDDGTMRTYTAHFVPKTFMLYAQAGETYVVQAQLEVIPDPTYASGDATIIAAGPQN